MRAGLRRVLPLQITLVVLVVASCAGRESDTRDASAPTSTTDPSFGYKPGTSEPWECGQLPMPSFVIREEGLHDCWAFFLTDVAKATFAGGSLPDDREQGLLEVVAGTAGQIETPLLGSFLLPDRVGSPTIYEVTDRHVCFTTPRGGFGAFAYTDQGKFVDDRDETECPIPPP